ncbi:hypothetical protein FRC03_010207 [Tulasnella sp. 419]|nr:hypothetical protein FRC03_010207 [Tulasnella sp. 419]
MRSLLFITFIALSIIALHSSSVDGKRAKRCKACKKRHGQHTTPAPVFQTTSASGASSSARGAITSEAITSAAPSKTPSSSSAPTSTSRSVNEDQSNNNNGGDGNQDNNNNEDSTRQDGSKDDSNSGSVRTYKIQDKFEGKSFFDGFDFQNIPDPTHGSVNYLDRDGAFGAGLAYVQDDGVTVMKVDDYSYVNEGGNRNSVRIQSKASYPNGLIVLDVEAMPFGCGVWPAFWTVGPNWPNGGEIDILENVHDTPNNHMTLHTAAGCTVDRSFQKIGKRNKRSPFPHVVAQEHGLRKGHSGRAVTGPPISFTGTVLAENCDANVNSNTGCGIKDPDPNSFGSALNNVGGGVFAALVNDDGVAVCKLVIIAQRLCHLANQSCQC